jgi:[protein-PII] uridylyltransferase
VSIWEGLDQAGLIEAFIPGWSTVRSAPQRNAVHRFTVDRHLVETAVQASSLTRTVDRPDLLLISALLHDFGKARGGDHSVIGADLAAGLTARMGLWEADARTVVRLVRHHLLLADVATRRDLQDPVTIAMVAEQVQDPVTLDLLAALTQADSLATGPGVWTHWKESLVAELVSRVHAVLAGRPLPEPPDLTDAQRLAWQHPGVWVLVGPGPQGPEVTVAAPDQVGLLATVAGVLSVHRLQVRAARVRTIDDRALQVWNVEPVFGDPPTADRLAEDIRLALDGRLEIQARLAARDEAYRPSNPVVHAAPRIEVIVDDASPGDQVRAHAVRPVILEVRAHDAPGLLHRIAGAIAEAGATITGAKVATLGSEVVDVFFLADARGRPLTADRQQAVLVAVRRALGQQIA